MINIPTDTRLLESTFCAFSVFWFPRLLLQRDGDNRKKGLNEAICVLQHMSLSLIKLPAIAVSQWILEWLLMAIMAISSYRALHAPGVFCAPMAQAVSVLAPVLQPVPCAVSLWGWLCHQPVLPAAPARHGQSMCPGVVKSQTVSTQLADILKPKSWCSMATLFPIQLWNKLAFFDDKCLL